VNLDNKLIEDIILYCSVNHIDDIEAFTNKMLKNGFMVEKYGEKPPFMENKISKIASELIPVVNIEPVKMPIELINSSHDEETKTKKEEIKIKTTKPVDYDEDDYNPRKAKFGSNLLD